MSAAGRLRVCFTGIFFSFGANRAKTSCGLGVENRAKQDGALVFAWAWTVDRIAGQKPLYSQASSITPGDLFWLQTPRCNDTVKRSRNGSF